MGKFLDKELWAKCGCWTFSELVGCSRDRSIRDASGAQTSEAPATQDQGRHLRRWHLSWGCEGDYRSFSGVGTEVHTEHTIGKMQNLLGA